MAIQSKHVIKAPVGNKMQCKNWIAEAAMRMLMNNLDSEVAEAPEKLVVYGGSGKAARNWECYEKIIESLKNIEPDETLLVSSGKPVGILKSHTDAPKVLIANSNLVPAWANWDKFRELEKMGLTMYGQMTAGSWIYIGTQGILQGTYETFVELARKHFNGTLKGKWVLTAGLGGMGGAQPLAVTFNEGVCLAVDVDKSRIQRRIDHKYCDIYSENLEEALNLVKEFTAKCEPKSIGLLGNAAEIFPKIHEIGFLPDVVTDQTSAHDTLNGYVPIGDYQDMIDLRCSNPEEYMKRSLESINKHVQAMLDLQKSGCIVFDYGNNIRQQAYENGINNAFDFPGFVPAYIRPLFCQGKGPFRWVALSGDPEDIYKTDEAIMNAFPNNEPLKRWLKMAKEKIHFQGLPSRICWLGYGERAIAGKIFNDLVASGEVKAPIVIGRDHLDCGSVASPNRETEGMKDGSDAIADWPILNALINSVNGASWVSFHHGGGVGIGYSLHAGMVIVADGTKEAEARLERVLTSDPGMGIIRHVDAKYDLAIENARKHNIKVPFLL